MHVLQVASSATTGHHLRIVRNHRWRRCWQHNVSVLDRKWLMGRMNGDSSAQMLMLHEQVFAHVHVY